MADESAFEDTFEYIGGRTLLHACGNGEIIDWRNGGYTFYDHLGRPTR